jgi:hypothetical protein
MKTLVDSLFDEFSAARIADRQYGGSRSGVARARACRDWFRKRSLSASSGRAAGLVVTEVPNVVTEVPNLIVLPREPLGSLFYGVRTEARLRREL